MTTVSPEQWEALRSNFLQRYPDFVDFAQPGKDFAERELTYKRKIIQRFEARKLRQILPALKRFPVACKVYVVL